MRLITRHITLLLGLCLLHGACLAQQKFVGRVLDEHYRPVPGVVVRIKGTRGATVTDQIGKFSMTLPSVKGPVTLVISSVGYEAAERQIINFDSVYTFRLIDLSPEGPADPVKVASFPWPPPKYSCQSVIDRQLPGPLYFLKDVDKRLSAALDSLHYDDKAYYYIPGGFAMVSRIEQINKDGESLPPPDRWSVQTAPMNNLSWREYIRRLFFSTPGYFRIMVFAVTDQPFAGSNKQVSRDDAIAWLSQGSNVLPENLGNMNYTPAFHCTAIIYEYKKPESGEPALNVPGMLTGFDHLKHSKLLDALHGK